MNRFCSSITPLDLRQKIKEATDKAIRTGALEPFPTSVSYAHDEISGMTFVVRKLESLKKKAEDRRQKEQLKQKTGAEFNPFLPYDNRLFVADFSRTHVGLLNKFNVMDDHLLIVTREFEHQHMLLTKNDFEALIYCLAEIDGIGFYNSGEVAGASQRHKHLQFVPLPLSPRDPELPIHISEQTCGPDDTVKHLPFFDFPHGFISFQTLGFTSVEEARDICLRYYYVILESLGSMNSRYSEREHPFPYNLLMTRQFMLLVPRLKEHFYSISLNALAFAGSLFVKTNAELAFIAAHGPMAALNDVAGFVG